MGRFVCSPVFLRDEHLLWCDIPLVEVIHVCVFLQNFLAGSHCSVDGLINVEDASDLHGFREELVDSGRLHLGRRARLAVVSPHQLDVLGFQLLLTGLPVLHQIFSFFDLLLILSPVRLDC